MHRKTPARPLEPLRPPEPGSYAELVEKAARYRASVQPMNGYGVTADPGLLKSILWGQEAARHARAVVELGGRENLKIERKKNAQKIAAEFVTALSKAVVMADFIKAVEQHIVLVDQALKPKR